MKVTVNFGSVRVIVPCGKGDLPVKQLMDLAITRYKKATGKSLDSWVTIHNLKLLSDGGILDPDDKLNDVADDREQITAVYDEEISSYLLHNGGDGTSASSIGTASPDIFQNGDLIPNGLCKSSYNESDVEITDEKIYAGLLPLHVRRGSEPALNQLPPSLLQNNDNCKRWSAAVLASGDSYKQLNSEGEEQSEDDLPPGEREDGSGEEKSLSLQNINSWTEETNIMKDKRKEPLGGPITSPKESFDEDSDCSNSSNKKMVEILKLKNEDGPLGIQIVPANESPDKNEGVIIQGIEPGGRIDRDGRFSIGDRITEINGLKLSKDSYRNAQEILKDALKEPILSIHCIKKVSCPSKSAPKLDSDKLKEAQITKENDASLSNDNSSFPLLYSTPTKKLPTNLLHKGTPNHSSIRKVGRRILVHLSKGPEGLGFSITSKDPENGPPFFIKSILPAGAAVDDGRLKTGDKLLEVNKVDVSNMTQSEVLNLLRKVPFGDVVELVISRQETDLSPSPSLPRELPPDKCEEEMDALSKKRDIFTLQVALNDTGSAGLGVSVKGKTSNTSNGAVDMGIFIKNIFHGGAAHKDGRLQNNDQLLNVNGIPLLGMTNGQAMETLRRAMIQGEGPNVVQNAIILTVARRVPSILRDTVSDAGDGSSHDRSDSLLSESGDSFYVSNENLSPTNNKFCGQTPDTSTSDNSANTVIFRSPSFKRTESDIDEEKEDDFTEMSSVTLTSDHNPILERLISENLSENYQQSVNNSNSSNYHKISVQLEGAMRTQNNDLQMQDDVLEELNSFVNHKKSVSSPVRLDFSQQSEPNTSLEQINENGASLTKEYRHKNHLQENGSNSNISYLQSPECQNISDGMPVREMPVDVGPYEISSNNLALEQAQRATVTFYPTCCWSCNSPDCPYHAVPTRRESGSSEEACTPVGPSLGLMKSSSLESLQTMVQEQQKRGIVSTSCSARACNESFRQAVDKSFEAPAEDAANLNGAKVSQIQNLKTTHNHTRAKTVDSATITHAKQDKPAKKKGIFRGLGSVFRFGKSSKKANKESSPLASTEQKQEQRIAIPDEQKRIQKYVKEAENHQTHHDQKPQSPINRHVSTKLSFTFPRNANVFPMLNDPSAMTAYDRQAKMHLLRTEHQRRHQQRNGFYPQEDREELYEAHLKQNIDTKKMMNRPLPPLPHQMSDRSRENICELSSKSKTFEMYKEMSKPGSRKGFADPNRYSHYMNFQEIQQHLQQFRFHQSLFMADRTSGQSPYDLTEPTQMSLSNKRHYRHTVSSPRSRPTSEYIDFRSPELLEYNSAGTNGSGSLPRKMFTHSKQRPRIPAAFMADQKYIDCNERSPSKFHLKNHHITGSKV
ncbi:partitioning defective 3 homolog B-like [Uloborus diversus]|uniref:partitioning defective 3 homolog B-like n=1 Tax=Uloborus diversus TaxID=327109 RepID=UPI002409C050|nr:partitioning defective 3 homolog B-like [Uloborus diversus]